MNTPFSIKRFQFQACPWKSSSIDRLEDLDSSFTVPQHVEGGKFLSSAASLPATFEAALDFTSSAASLPEIIDSDESTVGPYDVLCGRDKHSFRNVGNRRFRVTIALFMVKYVEAETKCDKSRVIASVVETVRANGGRFLKWSHKRQEWVELDEKHTREKVGHALRDTAVAKVGQSATTGSSHRSKLSASSTSILSLSASIPPSTLTCSQSCVSRLNGALESAPAPDQVRSARRHHSPLRSSVASLHHSLKSSLQLTPDEIRELFSLDQVEDAIDGLCHRTSFISVASLPVRDKHVRVGSFDSDDLFLDVEEVEKLIADAEAEAYPTSRGRWDEVPEVVGMRCQWTEIDGR